MTTSDSTTVLCVFPAALSCDGGSGAARSPSAARNLSKSFSALPWFCCVDGARAAAAVMPRRVSRSSMVAAVAAARGDSLVGVEDFAYALLPTATGTYSGLLTS